MVNERLQLFRDAEQHDRRVGEVVGFYTDRPNQMPAFRVQFRGLSDYDLGHQIPYKDRYHFQIDYPSRESQSLVYLTTNLLTKYLIIPKCPYKIIIIIIIIILRTIRQCGIEQNAAESDRQFFKE